MTDEPAPFEYIERAPPPELAGLIESMWFLLGRLPQRYEKILPLPYVHLIINLGEPYRILDHGGTRVARLVEGAFVSGIQSTYLVNENPELLHHVGVRFRPGGLGAFSAVVPGSEVLDAAPLLPGATELRDALVASTPDAALTTTVQHLVRWLRPERRADATLQATLDIIAGDPSVPMATVAREVGVTPRGLIGHFTRGCGITPKRYAEVYRHFEFVRRVPDEPPFPTWAELSAAAGYYDQPHFHRAFVVFTGMTPREYLAAKQQNVGSADSFLTLDAVPAEPSARTRQRKYFSTIARAGRCARLVPPPTRRYSWNSPSTGSLSCWPHYRCS